MQGGGTVGPSDGAAGQGDPEIINGQLCLVRVGGQAMGKVRAPTFAPGACWRRGGCVFAGTAEGRPAAPRQRRNAPRSNGQQIEVRAISVQQQTGCANNARMRRKVPDLTPFKNIGTLILDKNHLTAEKLSFSCALPIVMLLWQRAWLQH